MVIRSCRLKGLSRHFLSNGISCFRSQVWIPLERMINMDIPKNVPEKPLWLYFYSRVKIKVWPYLTEQRPELGTTKVLLNFGTSYPKFPLHECPPGHRIATVYKIWKWLSCRSRRNLWQLQNWHLLHVLTKQSEREREGEMQT